MVSAKVLALAEGVTKAMLLTKIKIATLFILVLGVATAGTGVLVQRQLAAEPAEALRQDQRLPAKDLKPLTALKAISQPEPAAAKNEAADSIAYSGRVLGPDGRPVAGAKLYLTYAMGYLKRPSPSPEYATTGPDGRFKFTVPKAEFGDHATVVAAAAANHGVGWVDVPAGSKRDDLALQLVDDDEPITGQIVDLEGKPVPGATLRVMQINAAPGEDLGPWLAAAKSKKGLSLQLEQQYLTRYTIAMPLQVTTDAAGRFRLTGIGRNRLVRAQLDGPTIASQYLCILTRPAKPIEVIEHEGNHEYDDPRRVTTYYGASFRYVAAPSKPIVGVVRDKDTKKPLAGVTIWSFTLANNPRHIEDIVRTTTDAQGRYRLTGMPKGEGNKIRILPPRDLPYVAVHAEVPDTPGLDPVTVDIELRRGVWIEGKLTDKVTGKPLRGAVEYFSHYSNPNLRDYPGFDGTFPPFFGRGSREDGSYRVVGLPGPGLIAVYRLDNYLQAAERDDEEGVNEAFLKKGTAPYHLLPLANYGSLARIDPAKGVDQVTRDVTLDPGWTFTVTVLGPDGRPLAGAPGFGLVTGRAGEWDRPPLETASFTVQGFNPRRPRDVLFQHPEKGLIGVAQPPKENGGSVTVRMEPGAAVTGRLVDADGRPRADVELKVSFRLKGSSGRHRYSPESIKTDREGRFRLGALLPGYEYRLTEEKGELLFGGGLRSGQTQDLGDVQLKGKQE
jgi:hypothetical protein